MAGATVTSSNAYFVGTGWRIAQLGDYTGDARTDVIWTDGSTMQLWRSEGTSFTGMAMPSYPSGWTLVGW